MQQRFEKNNTVKSNNNVYSAASPENMFQEKRQKKTERKEKKSEKSVISVS